MLLCISFFHFYFITALHFKFSPMLLFFQDRWPGSHEPKVSLVLLLPGLMLRKLPGLSSALLPGQSETLILYQRALCTDLPLRAEDTSALRKESSSLPVTQVLPEIQLPALPRAIHALPHITELPLALPSKRLLLMLKGNWSQTHIPKMMLIYLLDLEPPTPEKNAPTLTQGLSSILMLPHPPCPSRVKAAGG